MLFNKMLLYPTEINIIKQSTFWFNTSSNYISVIVILKFSSCKLLRGPLAYKIFYIVKYFWYGTIFFILFFPGNRHFDRQKRNFRHECSDVSYTNSQVII